MKQNEPKHGKFNNVATAATTTIWIIDKTISPAASLKKKKKVSESFEIAPPQVLLSIP